MTNILDTVEPDSIADGFDRDVPLYSRETVERLLEAHLKQVLLEAAEWLDDGEFDHGYKANELRRMAEGEKHE
jgi:hypothetical protein